MQIPNFPKPLTSRAHTAATTVSPDQETLGTTFALEMNLDAQCSNLAVNATCRY